MGTVFRIILSAFCALALMAPAAMAAPSAAVAKVPESALCATPAEYQALNMRALQSELMVAALSCDQKRYYNWFAKEYNVQLVGYGAEIMHFFDRHGSPDSTKLLNDFMTKMANRASRVSLNRPAQQYCGQVASVYGALKQGHFSKVATLANQYYPSWHRIPLCKSS